MQIVSDAGAACSRWCRSAEAVPPPLVIDILRASARLAEAFGEGGALR
jgi:hypothetical protein